MSVEYRIGMLWMEGPLSFLEQLCVKSFVDAGHDVTLYHYGPLQNVPEGVTLADANTVLPKDEEILHARTGSPALHSDLFRYRLLEQEDRMIWADTDAYCAKPFTTPTGHFFAWESDKHINGGVLGLPKDSDALHALLTFTRDEYPVPDWYSEEEKAKLRAAHEAGTPVHVGDLTWGVWGPHALTHFLQKTGEDRFAMQPTALYPISYKDRRLMLKRGNVTDAYITDETYSVHFYGRRMRRRIVEREGGAPKRFSLIGKLMHKHGINAADAPIPEHHTPEEIAAQASALAAKKSEKVQPLSALDKQGRGVLNLTDLADRYGSDKGSTKHRYTELYHMLFLPYRQRKLKFLEMGLQIGGPEHGKSADRATTDVPSVRMWLEYFPQAEIYGLDVSDFSSFQQERFTFRRCDMDARENIATALAEDGPFDIILDDASHASHHQQNGFLELFGKLKSGGLYIIEDLRWQPKPYEKKGITKTADLFQSYLNSGVFEHSDPAVAAEFNAARADISGAFVFQVHYLKSNKDQVVVIHKR
ncbi:MAG: hypothetical protein AAFQ05_00105 [Pseudomonadota bacterium]